MALDWLLIALAIAAVVYGVAVLALVAVGRRREARALARFIPDCARLVAALLRDDRVPRRAKVLLALLGAYLASPIDLVPDVIPVAGQLDDAILAAAVLRVALRAGGPDLLDEHWPGPPESLAVVRRLAFARETRTRRDPIDARSSAAGEPLLEHRPREANVPSDA